MWHPAVKALKKRLDELERSQSVAYDMHKRNLDATHKGHEKDAQAALDSHHEFRVRADELRLALLLLERMT